MPDPKRLLISLLGLAVLAANGAEALKERIKFDPETHKIPGDDPEFTAVPEASSKSLTQQQKQRVNDVNGALDFLADFAAFQASQQQQADEEDEQDVAARADQSIYARLAKLRRQQAEAEEELEEANDDLDSEDPEEQFSESYVQSILGRFQGQEKLRNNDMDSKLLETTTVLTTKAPRVAALQQSQQQHVVAKNSGSIDFVMIALLTCLAVAAALGVIVSIFCFVKIQKRSRSTQRFDYSGPGNGSGKVGSGSHDSLNGSAASAAASKLTAIFGGAGSASNVDKKLANNATLYHFEHHKKEMMAAESGDVPAEFGDSDAESGDDNDDNDYTVYECPGLAPTGEMQVDNPLFRIKQQASQPAGGPATARVSPPVVVHGMPQSASPK